MRSKVGVGIVAFVLALPASAAAENQQYAPTPYASQQNGNLQYGNPQYQRPAYTPTPYSQYGTAQYGTAQYPQVQGATAPQPAQYRPPQPYAQQQQPYPQQQVAPPSPPPAPQAQVQAQTVTPQYSTPAHADPAPPGSDTVCTNGSCSLRRSSSCSSCSSCSSSSCSSCSSSCSGSNCGCDSSPSVRLSVTGLRFSATRVSTSIGETNNLGLGFAGGVDTYALDGGARGSLNWVLGGGDAGFEGMLAGTVDVGYRLDVTERQGPFGRAGFDGRMQGNDRLYFSTLELPRLTLGWQYLDGRTAIEAGIRGGPILTGRYNPGDHGDRRLSGSFEYGAFASATVSILKMEATVMRIDAKDTLTQRPVDVARGSFCAIAGKVGLCADLMGIRGDANMGPDAGNVQVATSTYAGISIGVASW